MKNGTEHSDMVSGKSRGMGELMSPGAEVEPVGNMGMDDIALESFMHEEVMVYVHPTREIGTLDVISPNVNGINMPIQRGVNTMVKRKYVEALKRCHSIKYEQRVQNPSQPENIQMVEKKVPDYPFDVIQDSPKGKSWLKGIELSL